MERLVMRIEPTADYPHGTRLPTDDEILQHPAVQAEINRQAAIQAAVFRVQHQEALARAREEELRRVCAAIRKRYGRAEERATTMRGLPNDIDMAEGFAAGVLSALHIVQDLPRSAPEEPT